MGLGAGLCAVFFARNSDAATDFPEMIDIPDTQMVY